MSTEEKPGMPSSAGGWVTAILVIVVLYLASPAPVAKIYQINGSPPPDWVRTVYAPVGWVYERVPAVKKSYDAYFRAVGADP